MRALHLAPLALLLVGCGMQTPVELVISPDFSPEAQAFFVEGAEAWFTARPELRVPVRIGTPANVYPALPGDPYCAGAIDPVAYTWHSPYALPRIGVCYPQHTRLQWAALHELGHAFSGRTDHLEEDGNVMSWGARVAGFHSKPTEQDLVYMDGGTP